MDAEPKKRRQTRQRQLILDELRRAKTHPTADELFVLVRKKLPRISLGTVYRNLEILQDAGAVRCIDTGRLSRCFDGDPDPHHHIRCTECGRIDDLEVNGIPDLSNMVKSTGDYRIDGYQLIFEGVCKRCRSGKNSDG